MQGECCRIRRTSTPPILTIGYQAARFEQVRDALLAAGTSLLIDVRAVAASRRPGFSKRLLAGGLEQAGIGYLHLQPLGTPKPGRDAVRRGDVATIGRIFRAHMAGDHPQAALAQAGGLATEQRVCLLCFERNHADCHRALVADMIANETGHAVQHLRAAINGAEPVRPRRRPTRS